MRGPTIFVEGGRSDNNEAKARCRNGFDKLFRKLGLPERSFRILPCGSRNETFREFKKAHRPGSAYVAMLVDSEDPVIDGTRPWDHLYARDGWERPEGATDDQVFLMTTCMETWIVADRSGLKRHYERHQRCLRTAGLPSEMNLEMKHRHQVQDALISATQDCTNAYAKNKRSFEALASVDPAALQRTLPAFARMARILNENLQP